VEIVAAREQRVEDAITGTGQIEAVQAIEVRPEAEGRIVEIHFREGARVAAGAPLTKVDDAELRAQVNRVTAERDLANQTLQRARQLTEQQASSPEELERAEATARATQAQLDLLQLRLERTVVRAPFAGVLGARLVSLGDYVTPQTRIVSLQTVSPQRAVLNVPERYAERLRVGQRVRFTVGALPGREFTGVVDFVDPVVRLPGRTILIKAGVPNPRGDLQPGMFIEGRLVAAVRERAVVIPEDAVLPLQGEFLVWVVTNDRAERRTVDLGVRTPGFVEVLRGVAAGEDVVVGGAERLSEGASVRATRVERAGGS
jgi:membrane fusion protein (multidrug efflux system)